MLRSSCSYAAEARERESRSSAKSAPDHLHPQGAQAPVVGEDSSTWLDWGGKGIRRRGLSISVIWRYDREDDEIPNIFGEAEDAAVFVITAY